MITAASLAVLSIVLGSAGAPLNYVILGDSTAAGVGAAYDQGIAMGTTRQLAQTRRVTMTNLGVSGARIHDVVRDQLSAAQALKPELVLLSVTANDVTHLTRIAPMRRDLRETPHERRSFDSA